MIVITRAQAKTDNLKYYYTGKQCVHGHIAKRQVSNGCCYECSLKKSRNYAKENLEKRRIYSELNKEKLTVARHAYIKKNKVKIEKNRKDKAHKTKITVSTYYENNKESIHKYKKQWYQENKDKHVIYSRDRYARVKDDIDFRLSKVMRQMIRRVLFHTGGVKNNRTFRR